MIYPNSPGNNYKYSLHKKAMRLTALKHARMKALEAENAALKQKIEGN